jgi:hypothetical protein
VEVQCVPGFIVEVLHSDIFECTDGLFISLRYHLTDG